MPKSARRSGSTSRARSKPKALAKVIETRPLPASEPLPSGWAPLAGRLATAIKRLPADHFLIITVPGQQRFVQFAKDADGKQIAECVSDMYLEKKDRLTAAARRALARMGWQKPTRTSDKDKVLGSTNWWREFSLPTEGADIAALAVRTLAEVYGVRNPRALRYKAFSDDGKAWSAPELKLAREKEEPTPPQKKLSRLERKVGEAIAFAAEGDMRWQKGASASADREPWSHAGANFRLTVMDARLTVAVSDQPPLMRVYGTIEPADDDEMEATLALVNRVNAHELQMGYTYAREGEVRYAAELLLEPFTEELVWCMVLMVAQTVKALQRVRMGREGPKVKRTKGSRSRGRSAAKRGRGALKRGTVTAARVRKRR